VVTCTPDGGACPGNGRQYDTGGPPETGSQIADHVAFTAQPTTTAAGLTIAPPVQVAIQDVFGNTVASSTPLVTIAIKNNPSGGTLSGTLTKNAVGGVATFDDLKINNVGTGYTLMASSGLLKSATSASFNIVSEPLTIVTGALPEGTVGEPYSQNVVAKGGVPPYMWDIAPITGHPEFALPDGMTLAGQNSIGTISGPPNTIQVRSFRLRVTDASDQTATQDLCIHINASTAGPLVAARNLAESAASIAQTLVGEGVTISSASVTYTGAPSALGKFTGGFPATGLSSGIILSSGLVANVNPPNTEDGKTADNNTAGDAELNSLNPGYTTYDAAILEFDFMVTDPDATAVKFDYVFASEEYNEYANTSYNDVFGFFMSGPGFPKTNLALIPNTGTPVSINNVNGGNPFGTNAHNPSQFVNNDLQDGGGAIGTQADGLTKVFSVAANITQGVTYHLKIGIADAGDRVLDSWVLIKAGSFAAVCPIVP